MLVSRIQGYGTFSRSVRDILFQTALQANLGPQKEVENLLPPSSDPPADVFLWNWSAGRSACLDLTATNVLQAATVAGCAEDGAHAVQAAVDRKVRYYTGRCEAQAQWAGRRTWAILAFFRYLCKAYIF